MSELESVGPEIWSVHNDLFLPGGLHFPGRMVVVRLSTGGLLLHSPVPIDDTVRAELDVLGPVEHIVAPNKLHHLYIEPCQQAFPEAVTWGAPGLPDKRPDLRFDALLTESNPAFSSDLEPLFIPGIPWMNETVFFHRASRSAIVTDLFFNLQAVANARTRWFFTLYGVFGRPRQSPVVWWMTRDVAAAGAAARQLVSWAPDRVIPAHGAIVDEDAPAALARVLRGMTDKAPPA